MYVTRLSESRFQAAGRRVPLIFLPAFIAIISGQGLQSQQVQGSQGSPTRPTFRAGTNAVIVDLRVVDRDGTFISDLTKGDFHVFEDDEEQVVTELSLIKIPTASPISPSGVRPVAPDVVSNSQADQGRLYVMILDDLEGETEQSGLYQALRSVTVRAIARDFVEHHMTDNDRVALVTTSGRRNMTVQFTNDRNRLLEAIDRFQGGFGQLIYTNDCSQTPCRFVRDNLHSVMVSLRLIATWLGNIDGRRKAIVLVSERLGRSGAISLDLAAQEALDIQYFLQAAARGNVSLYAIDPVGQPTGKPGNIKTLPLDDHAWLNLDRAQSLAVLSEATGGFAAIHTNDYTSAFTRVVDENSSYYLLGYTPSNALQDGRFRKIRVEVTRQSGATSVGRFAELKVLARSGYATEKPSGPATPAKSALPQNLENLIRSPVPVVGLDLSVAAAPFRGSGSKASVTVVVEARPTEAALASQGGRFSGAMDIAIIAADVDGRTRGGERGSLKMNLLPATRDKVVAQGVRMLSSIELQPGEYHLNVAVVDSGSGQASGAVRYDLTVPDFTKPLTMSGIALASDETGATPTNGSLARWKSLGIMPTTMRAFRSEDTLRLFAEIYDNEQRRAHQTRVVVSARSNAGSTVFEQELVLPRVAGKTVYPVDTKIPLGGLASGEYLLTVEARTNAAPATVISRQIPFSVGQ
jgi:VWFA-related protein